MTLSFSSRISVTSAAVSVGKRLIGTVRFVARDTLRNQLNTLIPGNLDDGTSGDRIVQDARSVV
jgi:hypothetical protein